jgi:hypothetical protein
MTYVVGRDGVLRAILRPDETQITPRSLARTVLPLLRAPPAPPAPGPPNLSTQAAASCAAGTQLPCRPGRSRSGRRTVATGPSESRVASRTRRSERSSS